jgi:hypothetical protein
LKDILDKPDEHLKESLREILIERTMLEARTVDPIISRNNIGALRSALSVAFGDIDDSWEVFDQFHELDGAGVFFSSYMLSVATTGKYIVYHENLLDGLEEILPSLVAQLLPVQDTGTYFAFHLVCEALLESYRFNSFWEIHEFLWHGHDTEWTFK